MLLFGKRKKEKLRPRSESVSGLQYYTWKWGANSGEQGKKKEK